MGTVLTVASAHLKKVTYSPFEGLILQLMFEEFKSELSLHNFNQ